MGLKVADSYFIDPDTGKEIEVQMRYNGNDSTMQTPHNYFRMKNGKVEKQRDEDLWEEPNTEDPNYWLNNFKQAIQNQQQPKGVIKYIWDKIFKQGQGGAMNYTQYLQGGGNVSQEDSQLQEIVSAFKENPKAIISQILESQGITDPNQAKQAIPAIIQQFAEIAEQTQDGELGEVISELANEIGLLKCGGKVRAKVKKARCGKKLNKGSKIPTEKKGGCPCQYRRVGGRLQLVDCNGIPVAKEGAVLKFQQPSGPIEYTNNWTGIMLDYNPATNQFRQYNRTAKQWENLDPRKLQDIRGSKELLQKIYNSGINKIGNILLDNEGNYTTGRSFTSGYYDLGTPGNYKDGYAYDSKTGYTRYGRNFQNSVDFNSIYDLATKSNDQNLLRWLQSHNNVGYRGNEIDYNGGKATWDSSKNKYVYIKPKVNNTSTETTVDQGTGRTTVTIPTKTAGQLMFERGLAPGTLSDYSLRGRQNWLNSEENQAYLEANGWDAARREAYRGSAADNRELLKLIQGRAGWQPEQVKPTLPSNLTEGQRTAVQAFDQKHNRYEGQMSDAAQYVRNAYAGAENGVLSNDDISKMNGAQAVYLSDDDFKRFAHMQADLGKDRVTKASSLMLNGVQYASPEEYNAQVNKINSGRWDQALIAAGAKGGSNDPNQTALQLNIASNLLSGNRDLSTRAGRRDLSNYMKAQGYSWQARQAAKRAAKNLDLSGGLEQAAYEYQAPVLAYSNDKNYLYKNGGSFKNSFKTLKNMNQTNLLYADKGSKIPYILDASGNIQAKSDLKPVVKLDGSWGTGSYGEKYGAPERPYYGLFIGPMRSLQARQNFVRNNADYFKAMGWTDAEIASYKGQADLNLRLAKQMNGVKAWRDSQVEALPTVVEGIAVNTVKPEDVTSNLRIAAAKNGGKLISYADYLK